MFNKFNPGILLCSLREGIPRKATSVTHEEDNLGHNQRLCEGRKGIGPSANRSSCGNSGGARRASKIGLECRLIFKVIDKTHHRGGGVHKGTTNKVVASVTAEGQPRDRRHLAKACSGREDDTRHVLATVGSGGRSGACQSSRGFTVLPTIIPNNHVTMLQQILQTARSYTYSFQSLSPIVAQQVLPKDISGTAQNMFQQLLYKHGVSKLSYEPNIQDQG
eukprot:5601158-Amphidinium_carterae.1